jgi:YbbR domain-containing protein
MHKLNASTFILFLILGLFYFSGCTTEPVETDLLLPVDFSNVPENMVLTDVRTDKIEIRIQATPKLIELINKKNVHYPVDLYTDLEFDPAGDSDSIEPGAYLIPVEEKRIPMDPAIKILSMNPSYLSVQLEKKIKKTFKITVPYAGKPAKGYIALDAATDPSSVELTGAAPLIRSIKELKTKPVDLTNAHEDFRKKIPLDLDNSSIISSSDHIIIVTVPVRQQLVSKKIENIPIQVWNSTSRVNIEPSEITIQVKGPFETLNNKKIMGQIYSFIDLKDLKPGVYARHAYINIPVDLIMTDADPQVFTIKIE